MDGNADLISSGICVFHPLSLQLHGSRI